MKRLVWAPHLVSDEIRAKSAGTLQRIAAPADAGCVSQTSAMCRRRAPSGPLRSRSGNYILKLRRRRLPGAALLFLKSYDVAFLQGLCDLVKVDRDEILDADIITLQALASPQCAYRAAQNLARLTLASGRPESAFLILLNFRLRDAEKQLHNGESRV